MRPISGPILAAATAVIVITVAGCSSGQASVATPAVAGPAALNLADACVELADLYKAPSLSDEASQVEDVASRVDAKAKPILNGYAQALRAAADTEANSDDGGQGQFEFRANLDAAVALGEKFKNACSQAGVPLP